MLGSGMSPESFESRFAALAQRVSDFIDTVTQRFRISDEQVERRFRELDQDIRAFAPVIRDVDRLRDGQQRNNDKLAEMAGKVDAIHTRLDKRDRDEESDRKDREKEKRASSRQLWFILAGVLASSVGTFVVQLLHVGTH